MRLSKGNCSFIFLHMNVVFKNLHKMWQFAKVWLMIKYPVKYRWFRAITSQEFKFLTKNKVYNRFTEPQNAQNRPKMCCTWSKLAFKWGLEKVSVHVTHCQTVSTSKSESVIWIAKYVGKYFWILLSIFSWISQIVSVILRSASCGAAFF